MRRGIFIAVGLAALLIGGVLFIPATVIVNLIDERLAPRVVLQAVDGTVWSGGATVNLMPVQVGGSTAKRPNAPKAKPLLQVPINWSFAPTSLLRGRFGVDVKMQSRDLTGSVRAEAGLFNLAIRDADVTASMDALAHINQQLSVLKPSGRIEVLSTPETVTFGYSSPHEMTGALKLNVTDVRLRAGVLLGLSVPIGSYAGTVRFAGERIEFRVDSSKGAIGLTGSGHVSIDANRELHYDGSAFTLPGSPAWLVGALATIGTTTPDGRVKLNFKTRW